MALSRLLGVFRSRCKHPETRLVQKVVVREGSQNGHYLVASIHCCRTCGEVLTECSEVPLEPVDVLRQSGVIATRRAGATHLCDLNGRPLATFSPNTGAPFVRILGLAEGSRLRQVPPSDLVQRALLLPLERPLALDEVEDHLCGGRQVA